MNARSILSEAWRNITTGTGRVPLFAILLAAIAALGAGAEIATVNGLVTLGETYVARGGAVHTLISEQGVSGRTCAGLTGYSSLDDSGALRKTKEVEVTGLPGTKYQAYEVTEGIGKVLGMTADAQGVWISNTLASSLGVTPGSALTLNGTRTRIAGTYDYPADGRDARLEYAVLLPVSVGADPFDECWTKAWPQPSDMDAILRSAVAPAATATTEIVISKLNKGLADTFEGASQFQERTTKWAPAMTLTAGILLGYVWTRLRKLEYAAALHAGQSRSAMTLVALIESQTWTLLGAAIAALVVVGSLPLLPALDTSSAATYGAPSVFAATSGVTLGTLIGMIRVRESHLFRYFKDR